MNITDCQENLVMKSYDRCVNSSPDYVKNERGNVYDTNGVLVMKTYSYMDEITTNDLENQNFQNLTFFESHEGTVIRLFYHNNKWYVCTQRKLDAYQCRWADNRSFGELFEKAIETTYELSFQSFLNQLDSGLSWCFLLRHSRYNRLVCFAAENQVYFVGAFRNGVKEELNDYYNDFLVIPRKLEFENKAQLDNYLSTMDIRKSQGVVCFTTDGRVFKIFTSSYKFALTIRASCKNLWLRYLEIMNTELIGWFEYLFHSESVKYENILCNMSMVLLLNNRAMTEAVESKLVKSGNYSQEELERLIRYMKPWKIDKLFRLLKPYFN